MLTLIQATIYKDEKTINFVQVPLLNFVNIMAVVIHTNVVVSFLVITTGTLGKYLASYLFHELI